jgi:hypothetical protein
LTLQCLVPDGPCAFDNYQVIMRQARFVSLGSEEIAEFASAFFTDSFEPLRYLDAYRRGACGEPFRFGERRPFNSARREVANRAVQCLCLLMGGEGERAEPSSATHLLQL